MKNEQLIEYMASTLPYSTFYKVDGIEKPMKLLRIEIDEKDGVLLDFESDREDGLPIQVYSSEAKPFVRTMDSMTREEKGKYSQIILCEKNPTYFTTCAKITRYLDSIHIDYFNLAENDMAIAVTEENNPYA